MVAACYINHPSELKLNQPLILRYLDNQGRPDHQVNACDTHARELCAELRVIDRGRRSC
jgi:hypothetical protein